MSAADARVDRTAEALRSIRERRHADAAEWPAFDPLPHTPSAKVPADFPVAALGPVLGPATWAIAESVQVPPALAAGSVLAAAAVAAQPHADVLMPHGQPAPLSLYIVTSAESGDRKSAADAVASAPVEEQRRRDARSWAGEATQLGGNPSPRGAERGTSKRLAPRSLVVSKTTVEGLHELLKGQSSVGLMSPEGAETIFGYSMRDERRPAGIAWMLKAWGGETLDALTRGDGLSVLLGRRVSMHVLVQPVILQALMADRLAAGQGLIARCLIAAPASLAGTRLFQEGACPPGARSEVLLYYNRLQGLLGAAATTVVGGDNLELAPRQLAMSSEARALWAAFYDAIERRQASGLDLSSARPFAAKAAEHAARIAGILTVVADEGYVSAESMLGGIEVVAFYLDEHLRLLGQSGDRLQFKRLHVLADWIDAQGSSVRHTDLLQRSPRLVRDLKAAGIAPLLDELVRRGYIRRRGDCWELRRAH